MGDGSKIIKLGDVHMESSSSSAGKRTRGPSNGLHVPNCLVDGCRSDLSKCRDYHRRHKVCEAHSKTPKVTISGQEQRFCQQCSRFHSLGEFDEEKRSCRKRLDGHNRRRRKPQPETLSFNAPRFLAAYQGTRYTPTAFPSSGLALGANPSTNMAAMYNPQSQSITARKHCFTGSLMAHNYTMQSHQSHMGSNHPELSQCGGQKMFSEWLHHHHRDNNNNNNNNKDDNNSVVESSCALSLLSSTQTGSSSSSASSSAKGTTGVSHHHHQHHQMMMQPDRAHSLAPTGLHYHSGNLGLFGQPIVSSGLVISEVNENLTNFHCHDMFRN